MSKSGKKRNFVICYTLSHTSVGTMEHPREKARGIQQEVAPYIGLGFQLAATVGMCGLAGWWVGDYFALGSAPMVMGLVLGSAAGLYHFIAAVLRVGKSGLRAKIDNQTSSTREQ